MNLNTLMRYVERKTGAAVNLESFHPAFLSKEIFHLSPDQHIHACPYCRYIKTGGGFHFCHENKLKSIELAGKGRSFRGCCVNGVWELAVPLIYRDSLAVILYLGGFRSPEKPLRILENANPPGSLKMEMITPEKIKKLWKYALLIKELIQIELDLYHESNRDSGKKKGEQYYMDRTLYFIKCSYPENVSITELAAQLRVNSSYLGQVIRQCSGKTFRRLLMEQRLEEAKTALALESHSVSHIAFSCGFSDSNYFSVVFKKYVGISPKEYRRRSTSDSY